MKPNLRDIFSTVVSKMPFPGMFIEDSEIKRLLLDEYEKVEILDLDASFQAYLKESGATENNARELAKQFYGKGIPDSCKIHDIKQTTIYRVLSSVRKCRKSFEYKVIDKNSVIAQAVDLAVQPIFRELDKIPGSCSRFVIPFVEFSEEDEFRAAHRIKKTMNVQDSGACLTHYRDAVAAFNNALAGYDINGSIEGQPNERVIDVEGLKKYFKTQFKGGGNGNIDYFDTLIEELKGDRSDKDFARIASMIYDSKHLNDRKPNTFADWYRIFADAIGVKFHADYKQNKLRGTDNLKALFSYLN